MSDDKPITWQSFQLEHPKLLTMVQQIQQTGLATIGEAWTLIIPPLSSLGGLPPPSCIFARIREHARDHETGGRWDRVQEIYTDFLKICKTFDPEHSTYHKAAAIAVDVYRIAKSTREVQEEQQRHGNDFNKLKHAEKILGKMINELDPRVKSYIAKVYELEGRPDSSPGSWNSNLAEPKLTERSQLFSDIATSFRKTPVCVGEPDIFGWTLLHYAARKSRSVERFLDGQDPRAMDSAEWTPLHYAAERGDRSIVASLLQYGADIEGQGRDGMRPLHCAAKGGCIEVVRFLLEAGANEDIRDNSRSTPLHWAAWGDHPEVVTALLKKGADEAARDDYGRTALHLAAQAGSKGVIESLLKKDVDVNSRDRDGATALHLAAKTEKEGVVTLLLDNKADIESKDNAGGTPLAWAIDFGPVMAIKVLIDHGATLNYYYIPIVSKCS